MTDSQKDSGMNIIKTGLGLSRTIQNVNRLRQIIQTLARNGLEDLIVKSGVIQLVPDLVLPKSSAGKMPSLLQDGSWAGWLGHSLSKSFEELGPGFIKLGQNLASREDLFPADFIEQMRRLQDGVKGIPFEEAMKLMRNCYDQPLEEIFSEILEKPIGTASIGVVYKAKLHTGQWVVIKLRRPDVIKQVKSDSRLFSTIVKQLERSSKELQYLNLSRVVESFTNSMTRELDFNVERFNSEKLKRIFSSYDHEKTIVCPQIYEKYCNDQVLVMEMFEGIPLNRLDEIRPRIPDFKDNIEGIVSIIFKSIFIDGFFHGDPHGGNLILLADNRIGVLDFGLCGSISRTGAISLISVLHALARGDFENMCYELLDVAESDQTPDTAALVFDAKEALSPYIGLDLQDIDSALVMQKILNLLARHRVYLPRDWLIVLRSTITLDGLGKSLEIKLDIFAILEEIAKDISSKFFNKEHILEESYWLSRNVFSAIRVIPRHLKWYLKEFSNRNYGIELIHKELEKPSKNIKHGLVFAGYSVITGALLISGSIISLFQGEIVGIPSPTIVIVLWALAVITFIKAIYRTR